MNKLENNIKEAIKSVVLKEFDYDASDVINLEIPKDSSFGDYSTNIAMRLTKELKKSPRDLAEVLVSSLKENTGLFTEVSIAGPGFINFRINQLHYANVIEQVLEEKELFGSSNAGNGLKVNVEYVSANPTGDLHPGHARGAATGDSLTRLMKFAGYDVTREFYLNDAGVQIDNMAKSLQIRYLNLFGFDLEIPEDGYKGVDIILIAEKLKSEVDDKYVDEDLDKYIDDFKAYGLYEETEKLKRDLELFRVEFDVWTKESDIYNANKVETALDKVIKSGNTYESEGALWLKTTDFGDDKDRVLVKSDKNYTY